MPTRTRPKKKPKSKGSAAGAELIAAMRQAVHAATTGDFSTLTVREVEIPDPTEYTAADVKRLREKLGVSQPIFAQLLGVSPELIAHWEYSLRTPAPLARRLLDKINEDPAAYLASLVRRRAV